MCNMCNVATFEQEYNFYSLLIMHCSVEKENAEDEKPQMHLLIIQCTNFMATHHLITRDGRYFTDNLWLRHYLLDAI